ncbi:MAG: hypothetical protein KUG82_10875 [Pseudomonadales bacterium]|nr:hypothetical protein [Pseudomonadales bacterium]
MRLLIIAFSLSCITTAYAANFYDFRLGPDGGVDDSSETEDSSKTGDQGKIIDFINVKDEHLMGEAQSEIQKNIIFNPDKLKFKDLKIITDHSGKKITCGKISTVSIKGKRAKFRPFSYSENGINMLKKTGFENDINKYGDSLRQREKTWQAHYKDLGC